MRAVSASVLLLGILTSAALGQKKEPPKPVDPIVGRWEVISMVRGDVPDDQLKGAIREHTAAGDYSLIPPTGSPAPKVHGTYMIDRRQTPVHIDFRPATGRYKDRILKGIMKIEDGLLTLAYAMPDQPRPTNFKPNPDHVLGVHKKVQ
jgi:uncharacterized protein (TIGR03067 family)